MTCHAIQPLLPLWAGDDLSAAERAAVTAHLQECPACAAAARELQASLAWLRSAPPVPFDEADRLRLRREVLARIRTPEADRRSAFRFRPVQLAAAAALLLALAAGIRLALRPVPVPPLAQVPVPVPQAAPKPATVPVAPAIVRVARARPLPRPAPEPEAAPAVARIEFQTSNPRIRIIWLASARPAATPFQENP